MNENERALMLAMAEALSHIMRAVSRLQHQAGLEGDSQELWEAAHEIDAAADLVEREASS